MVNVPNPIGLSDNTTKQLGRLWVLVFLASITLFIFGIIINFIRSR